MAEENQAAETTRGLSNWLPWLALVGVSLLLLTSAGTLAWRAAGTGPQVQVPMFYDAHYLFPRPWTQKQAAPGVPPDSAIALYGDNYVDQTFTAGADGLAMIRLPLDGPPGTPVQISLSDDKGMLQQATLELQSSKAEDVYAITFTPIEDAKGRKFTVKVSTPGATAEAPVLVYAVGGDRLGATIDLNEFSRPGNLVLQTYSRGLPGRWWVNAVGEQLLPTAFRLRLQQYKPPVLKGSLFSWLLLLTAGLSALLLVVASPSQKQGRRTAVSILAHTGAWFLTILAGLFLAWQIGSGRAVLTRTDAIMEHVDNTAQATVSDRSRPVLYADLTGDLWTAARRPEARFVETTKEDGFPAVRVPSDSRIDYAVTLPPGSRLRFATAVDGPGKVQFVITQNDEVLFEEMNQADNAKQGTKRWQEIALDVATRGGTTRSLSTSGDSSGAHGLWLMPQIVTDASWVQSRLPAASSYLPLDVRFGESVALAGAIPPAKVISGGETVTFSLLWQALAEENRQGKVFVHLLNAEGDIIGQHDSPPLNGAYPFSSFVPGTIIIDDHPITIADNPGPGPYRLAAGIYDPGSLERWSAVDSEGAVLLDGRAVVELPSGDTP
ncbi:MAG: hypothetical protein ACK2UK_14595 [Candidatus Promineifilaceae bacterium]